MHRVNKMKRVIFHIDDGQIFHIGSRGGPLTYFSSDRLFSAIVNTASLMYNGNELEEIIYCLVNRCAISSMFFGLRLIFDTEEERKVFFVKKPFVRISDPVGENYDLDQRKNIKKISFISEEILKELLLRFDEKSEAFIYDLNSHILIGGKYAVHRKELSGIPDNVLEKLKNCKFTSIRSVPGILSNRYSMHSENIFYKEFMQVSHIFLPELKIIPFMYFNIDGYYDERLSGVFNLMCDEGIGGERSCGAGMFSGCSIEDAAAFKNDDFSFYVTLSAVYPGINDIDMLFRYTLSERDGYVYSNGGATMKKPVFRMIEEGSIFKGKAYGQVMVMKPESLPHKLYIYGKSFLMGFKGGM
jgi:CRISPR-associated protein Csm4